MRPSAIKTARTGAPAFGGRAFSCVPKWGREDFDADISTLNLIERRILAAAHAMAAGSYPQQNHQTSQ